MEKTQESGNAVQGEDSEEAHLEAENPMVELSQQKFLEKRAAARNLLRQAWPKRNRRIKNVRPAITGTGVFKDLKKPI